MGTRGAFGFYRGGVDKITYNHFDSYPAGLGEKIVRFCQETSIEEMNEIFNRIEVVDFHSSKPTPEQIEECRPYLDLRVSHQSEEDWYCLLREAQGGLDVWKNGLRYMIDDADFLKDSLFCEWAYVINLDWDALEIYRGFQKSPTNNRYSARRYSIKEVITETTETDVYYSCKLIVAHPLGAISEWKNYWRAGLESVIRDEEITRRQEEKRC